MERELKPYRNVMVCYDGFRIVTNLTMTEFKEVFKTGEVNWFIINYGKRKRSYNLTETQELFQKMYGDKPSESGTENPDA